MRASLLGLFLLVALLAAACGLVTPTPEAAMEERPSAKSQEGTEANMESEGGSEVMEEGDDADSMMEEVSEDSMDMDDSDSMMEDSESVMEQDDSDAMMEEDSETTMEKDDSEGTMEEDPEATMEKDDSGSTMNENSGTTMEKDGAAATDLPAWFGAELIDVNSGQVLTVADLQGKVILVETMAIWCSNCLRQQKEVKALHEALGMRDDLATLVLDIDPNEDADNLRAHANKHGFSWAYAVAPREVAREIGQLYGDQFLNPPSTPMLIIDQHGEVHLLPFGRKTAQDLQEALEPFLEMGL